MQRPIGKNQLSCLKALRDHHGWSPGCGWIWDTASGTERILDSLVARDLAVIVKPAESNYGYSTYKISDKGKELLNA